MADYTEELEAIKEYYADLLILQYRNKKKARETVKLGVDIYTGSGLLMQLQDVLNIDTATGAQLDLIGKILGCSRTVQGLDINNKYFGFANNPDNIGFSRIGVAKNGIFKTWQIANYSKYSLLDEDYRTLLKFKALLNRQRGSIQEMNDNLYNSFGGDVLLINNQNLSISYIIASSARIFTQAAMLLGYFRAPLGIGLGVIIGIKNPLKIYGYKKIGAVNAPVGFSRIGTAKEGTFLTRENILNVI